MALYSVYTKDEAGDRTRYLDFDCESDLEAIKTMLDIVGHGAAELWCAERPILLWPGGDPNTILPGKT
jgi:hypothetical protein